MSSEPDDGVKYVPLKQRRVEIVKRAEAVASKRGALALARVAKNVTKELRNDKSLQSLSFSKNPAVAQKNLEASTRVKELVDPPGVRNEYKSRNKVKDTVKSSFEQPNETTQDEVREREAALLAELARKPGLKAAVELANDVVYMKPMTSSWTSPTYLQNAKSAHHHDIRQLHHVLVEGENVPPPCISFREMKLPSILLNELRKRGIKQPSPIQMQGLPVALSGRDMIGIAFTGSGKTMVFVIPLLLMAWEMEKKLPVMAGEGPLGMILAPSRELARQTFDVATDFTDSISRGQGVKLRTFLAMGGTRIDTETLRHGIHILVGTPGRLLDLLRKRRINLDACRYIALDEADRLIDLGFEEDIRSIFSFFSAQRQTLMFSATMPTKIQAFASSALVKPVVVNVGRAGAASLNITQHVELVRSEGRIMQLLDVLQKTPPPTLIFCENKSDVDEIHEFLLIKGVGAVSIHGSRDQEDRETAMRRFRMGEKDVLVATDVAAKGLDFPNIRHVINYDMPKDIQTYVHRIGRTGRGDQTGIATTFVRHSDSPTLAADLLQLLIEAKQTVPEGLYELVPDLGSSELATVDVGGVRGCAYCGGLSHRVEVCPTLESEKMKALVGGTKQGSERFNRGGFGGEW